MTVATKTVHCSLRSRPHCVWRQSAASRRGLINFPVSAASEAKQTHGRRCGQSFTIRDDILSLRGPLGRAKHPNAVWLESEGFLFDKTKRNLSERNCRDFCPCNRYIKGSALILLPSRPFGPRSASTRSVAAISGRRGRVSPPPAPAGRGGNSSGSARRGSVAVRSPLCPRARPR